MSQEHYLSKEKLEDLKKELETAKTIGRKEVAEKLAAAISMGDLSENAAYEEARDEQTQLERRLLELEDLISRAKVIDFPENTDKIKIGSTLLVKVDGKEKEFMIVGPQEADPLKGKISYESPLGKAFLNKKKGESIELNVPKGIMKYTIVKIL